MKINGLSCDRKHVMLLYLPACLVRKTRSDRLPRNPILILFRTLARCMGLLSLRSPRRPRSAAAPEPADPALVRLGPGGDFTRYWPEQPPPERARVMARGSSTRRLVCQRSFGPWPHK